ncbi:MAG: cation-translocating P-type ATPase [Clostridia bacterium]|nr:cation-translocating P-type ATPase [Clostridia bacterium]
MESKSWHAITSGEVMAALGSSRTMGLSDEEARSRLSRYGRNALAEVKRRGLLQELAAQFKEFLVILLLISAGISAAVGEGEDALIIAGIVILNAVLGVIQERRAENALDALKKMASPKARVIRSGQPRVVDASQLAPGDIILIEVGDSIPADARLIESGMLRVDASALTGESVPAEQSASAILPSDASLGDRVNMVYAGCSVVYGRGMGIVTETGMSTEMGKIASLLQEADEELTPLQRRLEALGRKLGVGAVALCAGVFVVGVLRHERPFDMFLTAVSLAVAAIPEGLPAIVTIVLALGVQRMASRNAIIRRLPAVETLGSASVICSDKTGTLTTNQMTVRRLYVPGRLLEVTGEGYSSEGRLTEAGRDVDCPSDPAISRLLSCAALCNDARLRNGDGGRIEMLGDPTEGSIIVAAMKAGIDKARLVEWAPRIEELPFESDRKRMTTVHRLPEAYLCCTKGAPDELIRVCAKWFDGTETRPLDDQLRGEIRAANVEMAEGALRVLGVAQREVSDLPPEISVESVESDMVFLGLVGMQDPARPEAAIAVKECLSAGITPVMITGDHKATAVAIARDLGIMTPGSVAITGAELGAMSDAELDEAVEHVSVYARVAPEHKVRIVDAWRRRGQVVAMTGDGVNDAPALKRADIGAAMGITGTDVAKGAADMILTDDNFATIVAAVREGRVVFENIKKSVQYLVSCNIGEILVVFAAIILGLPRPLLPIHILWLNLITDGLPALALGVDPPEAGIMSRRPRARQDDVLSGGAAVRLLVYGLSIAALGLLSFAVGLGWPGELDLSAERLLEAQTMCLLTMSFSQLFHAFNFRSETGSLFRVGPFANSKLVGAFLGSGLLQLVVTFVPPARRFLDLGDVHGAKLFDALTLAVIMIAVGELTKLFARTQEFRDRNGTTN